MKTKLGMLVLTGALAVAWHGDADAGISAGAEYSACASDIYGRPAAGVQFELTCFGFPVVAYHQSQFEMTGPDGCVSMSQSMYSDYDDQFICHFRRIRDERTFDFGDVASGVPQESHYLYDGDWKSVSHTSEHNGPLIDVQMDPAAVKGGDMVLWLSSDGVYDKPIILVDGLDVLDSRSAYDMWDQTEAMRDWFYKGVDVWVFNPEKGSETVREHIDELAWAIYRAQTYGGGNQQVRAVIGASTGGIMGRSALGLWEAAHAGDAIPSWFTFGAPGNPGDSTASNVGVLLTLDSPQRGANVTPKDTLLLMRQAMMGLSCNVKFRYKALAFAVGGVLGALIPGASPWIMGHLSWILVANIPAFINQDLQLDDVEASIDSPAVKDLTNVWCPDTNPSNCTSYYSTQFFDEINSYKHYPTTTRVAALSQGSWNTQRCDYRDQWGPGSCSGWGYDREGNWGYAERSSPQHVHVHDSGELFARAYPDRKYCSNHYDLNVEGKDLVAGSVRDMINSYAGESDIDEHLDSFFIPLMVATSSALDMDHSGAGTPVDDVLWHAVNEEHENFAVPASASFIAAYVHEYTLGDGDGFVTCDPIYSADGSKVLKGSGAPGKLCDCDPDDGNSGVTGSCNWQSRAVDATPPSCVSNYGDPCDGPDGDYCMEGTIQCDGSCSDNTGTTWEVCGDFIDNDCDGLVDEGCRDDCIDCEEMY